MEYYDLVTANSDTQKRVQLELTMASLTISNRINCNLQVTYMQALNYFARVEIRNPRHSLPEIKRGI